MTMNGEIKELSDEIKRWRVGHGFYTPSTLNAECERDLMLGKLQLVSCEVAEAAEAVRDANVANFQEELADIAIRVFDISAAMGIDLSMAIRDKMAANQLRPFRHGRLTTL